MKKLIALAAFGAMSAGTLQASPAVVFDMGGKFDKSFNQAAYEGAEQYKAESGDTYREFEVTNPAQREAADGGKYAIGVDSNQNYLHPGVMLTSMLKRVDVAVYEAMKTGASGDWKPGFNVLGLAEGGVDWALDEHNAALITDEMKSAVEAAKASIIAGDIAVHDYMSDNACTY